MPTNPSLKQSTPIWCKIGLLSFGGPAAQIALMHREIVENKNWLSEVTHQTTLTYIWMAYSQRGTTGF